MRTPREVAMEVLAQCDIDPATYEIDQMTDFIRARDAETWRQGFATGQSRAMRHMSDEPNLPLAAPNPYETDHTEGAPR